MIWNSKKKNYNDLILLTQISYSDFVLFCFDIA